MTTNPKGHLTGAALYKAVSNMLFNGGLEVEMRHASAYNPQNGWSKVDGIYPAYSYRFKPAPKRTVTIGYLDSNGDWQKKELVAPETVAPAEEQEYFAGGYTHIWCNDDIGCKRDLKSRRVFLCREDSDAMDDFLTECRNGGAK